jgi:hypothetical protein
MGNDYGRFKAAVEDLQLGRRTSLSNTREALLRKRENGFRLEIVDKDSVSLWEFAISSFLGSGVGTTLVGILFKRQFDSKLEVQKAFLSRASNVHARTVDTLATLYGQFLEAQGHFQGMTAGAQITGEISREEYEGHVAESMKAAHDTLMLGRLFIPRALAEQCDSVFQVVFGGRLDSSLANSPMINDPVQRARFWEAASTAAHKELPKILRNIEDAARAVMHGEQS